MQKSACKRAATTLLTQEIHYATEITADSTESGLKHGVFYLDACLHLAFVKGYREPPDAEAPNNNLHSSLFNRFLDRRIARICVVRRDYGRFGSSRAGAPVHAISRS
jgi:hypothetical protein